MPPAFLARLGRPCLCKCCLLARAYWQSGESGDKAGAYAIQGKGGLFVESLSGSYSGVVGLPVFETAALLRWAGISVLAEAAGQAQI